MTLDPEQERQRLTELYSGMTPEELENVADDAASLTDVARETLRTELSRRGLAISVDLPPVGGKIIEERDLRLLLCILSTEMHEGSW